MFCRAGVAVVSDNKCEEIRLQRIQNALGFLQKLDWNDLSKSSDQSYYAEFTKEMNPYKYVTGLFTDIKYVQCGVSLKNSVAYVNQGTSIINFCKKQDDCISTNNTTEDILDLATTLVHEARHVQNPKVTHVKCESGPLRSQTACDVSRSAKGGYHFETDFVVGMSRNRSLNPALRLLSSHLAIYELINHFNNVPQLDFSKNLLLKDSIGNLYLLNANLELISLNYKIENKIYDASNGEFLSFDSRANKFKFKMYKFNGDTVFPKLAFRFNAIPDEEDRFIDYKITQNESSRNEVMLFSNYIKIFQQWVSQPTYYDEAQLKTFLSKVEFPNALNITGILHSKACALDFDEILYVNNKKTVHRLIFEEGQTFTFKQVECDIDFTKIKDKKNIGQHAVSLTYAGQLLNEAGQKINGTENKKIVFISEPFDILQFIENENWQDDFVSQFK